MLKIFHLLSMLLLCSFLLPAQTTEELIQEKQLKEAELADKSAQLSALTTEVDALKATVEDLTDKITPYPRWSLGLDGTLGFNASTYTDWFSKSDKSTDAFNLGFSLTGWASVDQRKWFWKNKMTTTLGWNMFYDRDDPEDDAGADITSDVFNFQSLYGYKLSKTLAVSALADYRTALLEGRLNDPGFLDVGVGLTWTPTENLLVVVHPLNYNFAFSKDTFDFQSSAGSKLVVDYHLAIGKNLNWKTNLSAFASYKSMDYTNWTWTNGFTTAVRGVGVGFDFALRQNEQEARSFNPERTDNPLQTYFILGITYAIKT